MRGLALEGGGARGAYHIGVVKAYMENGYTIDGFSGTSIGAINAALLAQGDFERALQLWSELSMEKLFDATEAELNFLSTLKWRADLFSNIGVTLKKIVDAGGIDTSKMRAMVDAALDEDRIRASGRDLAIVTFSLTERRAYELYLEDIPQGQLLSYIMASACFPGFRSEVIDGRQFVDGGIVNNCPINMLLDKGYDEVLAVRTMGPGRFVKYKPGDAQVTVITPHQSLGNVMQFDKHRIAENIRLGYHDGLRQLQGLRGRAYYIRPIDGAELGHRLLTLDAKAVTKIGELLGGPPMPWQRQLFEHILPHFGHTLGLPEGYDWQDVVVAVLERGAAAMEMERFHVVHFETWREQLRQQEKSRRLATRPKGAVAEQLFLRALLLME